MRFDEMRRGVWDVHARVHDMDIDGVYASVYFPSALPGFCGHRLQLGVSDPELALAVRAGVERLAPRGRGPGRTPTASSRARSRGCSTPRSPPTRSGATPRAASRRSRSRENPEPLGLPSIHTGYWDPLLAACEETETVVCLHVGSSGATPTTSSDAPADAIGVLFFGVAMFAAVDWLYSQDPGAVPRTSRSASPKAASAGWPACSTASTTSASTRPIYGTWEGIDLTPREVMQRNFWFCSLEDDVGVRRARDHIGVDHILVETDYPHLDGTWPDTQEILLAPDRPAAARRPPTRSRGATRRSCSVTRCPTRWPPIPEQW